MKVLFYLLFLLGSGCGSSDYHPKSSVTTRQSGNLLEGSQNFWNTKAQNFLKSKVNHKLNLNKAKNVIFFIGDGLSTETVGATRVYQNGKEDSDLSFDKFPYYGLAKTYCVDAQVPDSACTAVAYFSGVKTNSWVVGVNANVEKSQCFIEENDHVETLLTWAQKSGRSTGFVTTTKVTHATPSSFYAHSSNRDWENDAFIKGVCGENSNFSDIAHQLLNNEAGKNLKVILGGGRKNFIDQSMTDDEGRPGLRTDGRNLIDEWLADHSKMGSAKYIWHKQELNELDVGKTDYLMGLFENDHCMYNLDIVKNNLQDQEPSLTDMTIAAIKMLQKDENGFFLFIEGGKIDLAHHDTLVLKALDETKEFSNAIEVARAMTSETETLIVVSSDHSHTMSYSGYAKRGNDIWGLAEVSNVDGLPYETLSYANGQSYYSTYANDSNHRVEIPTETLKNPERAASATIPFFSETHGGEDVGVYAVGPWSHLFAGSYEQNVIPLLIASAAQIGPYVTEMPPTTDSVSCLSTPFILIILLIASSYSSKIFAKR